MREGPKRAEIASSYKNATNKTSSYVTCVRKHSLAWASARAVLGQKYYITDCYHSTHMPHGYIQWIFRIENINNDDSVLTDYHVCLF